MKLASKMPVASGNRREDWVPVMELAAREVFERMLSCRLAMSTTPAENNLNITSMVGLAGKLCGVLKVRCNAEAAALMGSRMLGVDVDKVGVEMLDAMGEIANMVAGNFKIKISGLGDGCMLSPPTVITGSNYTMHSLADSPAVELHLLFENLPIVITLQTHS